MKCSKCGAEMVLRTASRGPRTGHQFYGCSNFPTCRNVVDISNLADGSNVENHEAVVANMITSNDDKILVPILLHAREKFRNYNTGFFETIALPQTLLEKINLEDFHNGKFEPSNQWRLDFPLNERGFLSEQHRELLLIANKILTRGKLTLLSPNLEKAINDYYKVEVNELDEDLSKVYSPAKYEAASNIWFDGSGFEKVFYEDILAGFLGLNYRNYVIPQVLFSSLIDLEIQDKSVLKQRVDFLITLPKKKIVVEIDEREHELHQDRDNNRDSLLKNVGYEVIRIKVDEIRQRFGTNLTKLNDLVSEYREEEIKTLNNKQKYLGAFKMAHQIQITIIEAMLSGYLSNDRDETILFDDKSVLFDSEEALYIVQNACDDIYELIENIYKLYQIEVNIKRPNISLGSGEDSGILLTYNENIISKNPKFIIQDISYPGVIANSGRLSTISKIENPEKSIVEYFLNYIFRKQSLWEGQFEAIERALSQRDAIVLLPTGSGKSIAFQLASMLRPGVTVVIDPIISLIDDQIDNLQRVGIDNVIGITSEISSPQDRTKIIEAFGQGMYSFCYVSPERFQTDEFRNALRGLTSTTPIALVAIDEAHCVSEWGHDFRTSYLNIGRNSRNFGRSNGYVPPILALTGTASSAVLRDVQRELQIEDFDAIITPKTFDRKELHFSVRSVESSEKEKVLESILQRYIPDKFGMFPNVFYSAKDSDTKCGLVFCPHVSGDFGVTGVADKIRSNIGISTKFYSGSAPKNVRNERGWNKEKKQIAREFKNNKFPLMVATKAFGMGIDKPNIRFTVHYGIPASIESFYQEAGRSGRDKKQAECVILLSNDDYRRSTQLLDVNTSPEEINKIVNNIRYNNNDDVTRVLWFHANTFKGIEIELENIYRVVDKIENLEKRNHINLSVPDMDRNTVEKSVHRLLVLGVFEDYTIDYASNEFKITVKGTTKEDIINAYSKYVSGYNRGRVAKELIKINKYINQDLRLFVKSCARILVEFIYDTIEKGRRRALREMLSLAEGAANVRSQDTFIREGILRYLESTYDEEIEKIIKADNVGFADIRELVDGYENDNGEIMGGIRSPKDAAEVRGQVARYLNSYPDHPGLLLLRSLTEIYCNDFNFDIADENIKAFINFSQTRYSIDIKDIYNMLAWYLNKVHQRRKMVYEDIVADLLLEVNDKAFARSVVTYSETDESIIYEPGVYLLSYVAEEACKIFE